MPAHRMSPLDPLAREALSIGDVRSAAIFVPGTTPGAMVLAAAAGIDGAALDGLVAAVQQPAHPVARALRDDGPTFDVLPMNPGGPTLRSHLPIRASGAAEDAPLGVLAIAHDEPMAAADRVRLVDLGQRIAGALGESPGNPG